MGCWPAFAGDQIAGLSRCGPVALQVCAALCGNTVKGDVLDQQIEGDAEGCTLAELQRVADLFGMHSLAVNWQTSLPTEDAPPAIIATVNQDRRQHFVVLAGYRNGSALMVNVPNFPVWMSDEQLRTILSWNGEALHISCDSAAIAKLRAQVNTSGRPHWFIVSACVGVAALGATLATLWSRASSRDTTRDA